MANYNCVIRSNYFHVVDEERFRLLMSRVYGCEDSVELWEGKDWDGNTVFAFGCYGGIGGVENASEDEDEDMEESAYDEFIAELQACVAEDDAIIIFESGHEKLRYVVGSAFVITRTSTDYFDLKHIVVQEVAKMIGQPGWQTGCEY